MRVTLRLRVTVRVMVGVMAMVMVRLCFGSPRTPTQRMADGPG